MRQPRLMFNPFAALVLGTFVLERKCETIPVRGDHCVLRRNLLIFYFIRNSIQNTQTQTAHKHTIINHITSIIYRVLAISSRSFIQLWSTLPRRQRRHRHCRRRWQSRQHSRHVASAWLTLNNVKCKKKIKMCRENDNLLAPFSGYCQKPNLCEATAEERNFKNSIVKIMKNHSQVRDF